ncbi:TPA: hypothetical protein DEP26_03825 [Candidatus Uhrbacteria bacterium]|nr:MAG: hypothetical protein A2332_01710 [Candidatus Uhrbacteria bacterium RIFOXYB2_FULL_41_18]HCB56069.1 hypothetical protein [Candidatus Uhrbacteria bacterium]
MPNIPSNWVGTEAVKSRLWRDPATMKRWRGGADIFRPWVMVYREDFETRTEALKRENQIKRYKRGLAFYKLIQIHG